MRKLHLRNLAWFAFIGALIAGVFVLWKPIFNMSRKSMKTGDSIKTKQAAPEYSEDYDPREEADENYVPVWGPEADGSEEPESIEESE